MFLDWILRNNISNKLYLLGFSMAVIGYTSWQPMEEMMNFSKEIEGSLFYIFIAFSFCCYSSAYMFTKWNKWRWFPMFVTLICVSRLLKEFYYLIYPEYVGEYDIFDYINFLITIWIVFNYYIRFQYKKFKDETHK